MCVSSVAALQYEQTRESMLVSRKERGYRVGVRSNITKALTALDLSTVNDIQQTSAALAQCTVSEHKESVCFRPEWNEMWTRKITHRCY